MASSNRERQIAETSLLESMYPDTFTWLVPADSPPDPCESPNAVASLPDLKFALQILSPDYTLEVTLPESYPETAKPSAYLSCSGAVTTSVRKDARAVLARVLAEVEVGAECLDVLIADVTAGLEELTTRQKADAANAASDDEHKSGKAHDEAKIKTVLLWSHHLLATSKRKDIVSWSRELRLAGFSRPGHPGAILIEGEEHDADEFVARIKALRWQALQVRGEEVRRVRRLGASSGNGKDFVVKEVEGLGDVADGLRKCDEGLAAWFLEGMKIAHG